MRKKSVKSLIQSFSENTSGNSNTSGIKWPGVETLENMPSESVEKMKVVGIDPGERYVFGAFSMEVKNPLNFSTYKIKQSAVAEPRRRFRQYIEMEKNEDICALERSMERTSDDDPAQYFQRFWNAFLKLHAFYNSNGMKKRRWDCKRAVRAKLDIAINNVFSMIGRDSCKKTQLNPNQYPEHVIACGDGRFNSRSSIHGKAQDLLYRKGKGLGITMVSFDEYRTSQRCPRCGRVLDALSIRSKCNHVIYNTQWQQKMEFKLLFHMLKDKDVLII